MLSKKEQQTLAEYSRELAKPKWRFIRFYALSWLVLVFLLSLINDYFFEKQPFILQKLWLRFLILLICGLAYAFLVRGFVRWQYKKLLQKQSAAQRDVS